ncbi:hypothetical protein BAU07_12625 [Bordetella flabilis]|uniref:Uncharacterized protein n=2 Tax=Bordetella flabilis TaxID=463014 RepID=A0A193GDY7_9BORD|nr:hypothetical protein BAU07_12625 [Bordetella flabilis]
MALEPVIPAEEADSETSELRDFNRRFWIALLPTVPVFALETGGLWADLHPRTANGLHHALCIALYIICIMRLLERSARNGPVHRSGPAAA